MEWKGGKHKKWQRLENGSSLLISFCIFPRRTQQLERISQQTEDRCGPHLTWGAQPWQAEGWSSNTGSVTCHMSLDESLQLWVPIYPHPQETVKSFFLTVLSWFHAFFYANLGGRDFFFYHGPLNYKIKSIKSYISLGYSNSVAVVHSQKNK